MRLVMLIMLRLVIPCLIHQTLVYIYTMQYDWVSLVFVIHVTKVKKHDIYFQNLLHVCIVVIPVKIKSCHNCN